MKPYKVDTIGYAGNRRLFIVIVGQTLGDDGAPEEYHAARGIFGLIVLAENGEQLDLVAKDNLYEEIGSYGAVPPTDSFAVRELGPSGSYGWVILEDYFHSGRQIDFNHLYAIVGDTVTSIGLICSRYAENEAACVGERCSDYSIGVLIDATARSGRFYPLILRTSGVRQGRPFNKMHRIHFDESAFQYVAPREIDCE